MIKIGTRVLSNLSYPERRPGVLSSVIGYHEGDYIVSLDTPLGDGSQATVVRDEALALLPESMSAPRATRAVKSNTTGEKRAYDNSLRDAQKCVKELAGVTVVRNKGAGYKFRVFAPTPAMSELATFKFGDYVIARQEGALEFTCQPSESQPVEETVDVSDTDSGEQVSEAAE